MKKKIRKMKQAIPMRRAISDKKKMDRRKLKQIPANKQKYADQNILIFLGVRYRVRSYPTEPVLLKELLCFTHRRGSFFFFFFFDSGFLSIRVQTFLKRIRLLVCHSSTISKQRPNRNGFETGSSSGLSFEHNL